MYCISAAIHVALMFWSLVLLQELHELQMAADEHVPREYNTALSEEHSAFVDHFPTSKFWADAWSNYTYGTPTITRLPRLLELFDWHFRVRGMPEFSWWLDRRPGSDPRTVLTTPDEALEVLQASRSFTGSRVGRVLVFMGVPGTTYCAFGADDKEKVDTVMGLHAAFSRILTVGNDWDCGIKTMPLGLEETRLRGVFPQAMEAIAGARLDDRGKPRMLLASHATEGKQSDSFRGPLLTFCPEGVPSTSTAINWFMLRDFYRNNPNGEIRRSTKGGQPVKTISRYQLTRWLTLNASRFSNAESWVIPQREWWGELSKYRFLLSPCTEEVQSVRNIEALLVLTIPITQRAGMMVADDLLRMGFPIVAVQEWAEINVETLRTWWIDLNPRLSSFRANCLTTTAFWRLITGDLESCS